MKFTKKGEFIKNELLESYLEFNSNYGRAGHDRYLGHWNGVYPDEVVRMIFTEGEANYETLKELGMVV